MKHPALTRFFAAFLAAVCALTLVSGALCVRKAAANREKQNNDIAVLDRRTADAGAILAELEELCAQYELTADELTELSAQYSAELEQYHRDLAVFTATEAAVKQGSEQLRFGLGEFYTAKAKFEEGEAAFSELEAQFNEGYKQFLEGKAALAESWELYYLAKEYVDSGVDVAEEKAAIKAGRELCDELIVSVAALRDTLAAIDPDKGINSEELAALISKQAGEILDKMQDINDLDEAALAAYESAKRFYEANSDVIDELISGGLTREEAEKIISGRAGELSRQIEATEKLLALLGENEGDNKELAEKLSKIRTEAELIASGELDGAELVTTTISMLDTELELLDYASEALSAAEELLTMLENLPEMKKQLDEAQKAMDESEKAILEGKRQIEQGREQLEAARATLKAAEEQLYNARIQLAEEKEKLIATRADLDERKARLESTALSVEEMDEIVSFYKQRQESFNTLKYALLANAGIAARVADGAGLIESAEQELDHMRQSMAREYSMRITAAALMLCGALAGLAAVIAAFREKKGWRILLPAALAMVLTAAAEGVSYYAGRGMIYTVLFVGVFALGVLALNLKKA